MPPITHLVTPEECDQKYCTADHLPLPRAELLAHFDTVWLNWQRKYWITNDKVKIDIVDMTSMHLVNTIQMMQRRWASMNERFKLILAMPSYDGGGDMAQLAADEWHLEMADQVIEDVNNIPVLAAMIDEINARRAAIVARMPQTTEVF